MRRLMLLRHAKAEKARPGQRDRDRVLNARGRTDAPKLGAYMARHALIPERVVVSPSLRTRETWDLVAEVLAADPFVVFDEHIYEAAPDAILKSLVTIGDGAHTLLVVGHNPGLHELAKFLVASGDVDLRERLNEEFPTSGLVVIDFALDDWTRLHAHSGRLDRFVSPRSLELAVD